eukprot:766697-Hanusia_phi.AAC.7
MGSDTRGGTLKPPPAPLNVPDAGDDRLRSLAQVLTVLCRAGPLSRSGWQMNYRGHAGIGANLMLQGKYRREDEDEDEDEDEEDEDEEEDLVPMSVVPTSVHASHRSTGGDSRSS